MKTSRSSSPPPPAGTLPASTEGATLETSSRSTPPLLGVMAGALGLGAVVCFLAAGLAFVTGGASSIWGWGLSATCLACAVAAWLGRVRSARVERDTWGRQRLALGANAVFSTALLAFVLVGLNFVVTRHHSSFDLTTNRINTLSPQTQRVLARLSGPVHFTYLYVPRPDLGGRPDDTALSLLETYRNASDRVSTEFVNVVADPLRARQFNPRTPLGQYGASAVLLLDRDATSQKGGAITSGATPDTQAASRQETAVLDEANVTSALLRLADPKPRTFYYLTGHSELDPLAAQSQLTLLRGGLEAQNVRLKALSLVASRAQIPPDAATVFAIAPQVDLSQSELNLLQGYLNGSGHLALMMAPSRVPLPRWGTLLQGRGVTLGEGLVWDEQQNYRTPDTPLGDVGGVTERERHPILRGTSQSVLFPFSATLKAAPRALGLTPLFTTSPRARSVTVRAERQSFVTRGEFARGPYTLSAAVERGDSRFWVTSSASFTFDQWNPVFGDGSFALSGLNWTAGDPTLVSIPPRPPVTNTLNAPSTALRFIQLFSLFTLPTFVLIAGGIVWWRRR